MTKEALKLALEALEENHEEIVHNWALFEKNKNAIYAIKEALEQPEQVCRDDGRCQYAIDSGAEGMGHCPKGKCVMPAQPEQEPVVWRNAAIRVGEDLCSVGPFGYYDMTAQQWLDWALSVVTVHTPPPQRKPLPYEQVDSLWQNIDTGVFELDIREFARAIEDAHNIKE